MKCHETRQQWNLYHDSEGDANLHFRISEHLAVCPDCAEWFHQQSRLESLLVDKLRTHATTPELWNRVISRSGLKQPPVHRRWYWRAAMAACALLILAMAWYALHPSNTASPDLAKLSAQWHQRLEFGEETPQFRSESDLEVEGYLRQRVTFPVRCPPRKDAGFAVSGAGVFRLADQPAAYLSGHVDAAPVSIFVLPRDCLATFPNQQEALLKTRTHHCQEGPYAVVLGVIDKNAVLVIGQASPERLEKVLSAYGTYPDHP